MKIPTWAHGTLPRNHYPPHPTLWFHRNRGGHLGHWLGWAHPTCLQQFRPHPPCTNNDFGDYCRHGLRMDASDLAQITRLFVAAIAAPHPAAGSLHILPSAPALSKPPPPDRLTAFPSSPTLLKALPPIRFAALSLVHVTINIPPRHRLTAVLRPPRCSRPRRRCGIASRRPHRPPLCPRTRPRRGTASRRSITPPLCLRPRPRAASPHGDPAGHRFVQEQDPAAAPPHGAPVGHRVRDQDPATASSHRVPAGTRFVQDLAANSPCSVSVGHISAFDHIAESPSSSEKAAVIADAPPGLPCRPPVVSPSPTSGVSVSTSPRASSGLISSRIRNRSAAAAGTPRTPADYGFGCRPPATAASRPPSLQRRPPTLGSRPAAQRPATTQRCAARSTSSPSTANPQPDPPSSSQTIDPRPPPPPTPPALRAPPRLLEPIVEPIDDLHLRFFVEHYTYTDWAREQRAEPLCSATLRFLSLGSPSPSPDGLLEYIPSIRRPSLAEVLSPATKNQLHTSDDNTVIVVHRPQTDPTCHACYPLPPPLDPSPRVYVPMLMRPWVLYTCHSTTSCHSGVSRTLSMLRRFYWWIGMDISTRWWLRHYLRCQARKTSRHTIRWSTLSVPLPNCHGIVVSVFPAPYPYRFGTTPASSFLRTVLDAAPTCTPLLRRSSPPPARPTSLSTEISLSGDAQ